MAEDTAPEATESQAADQQEAAAPSTAGPKVSAENLRVLENIEVQMTVEVGNTEIRIRDLLRLNEGSVVELDRLAGDPLDILVNGTMIAKQYSPSINIHQESLNPIQDSIVTLAYNGRAKQKYFTTF